MAVKHINIVLAFCLFAFASGKLSSHLTICSYDDPNISECVRKSAQELFRNSVRGIREYGIPPTDPLFVPLMVIDQGVGPVGLVLTLKDFNIEGIRNIVVETSRVDPSKYSIHGNLTVPEISIVGGYDITGKILLLPITGKGNCKITFLDNDILVRIQGKSIEKNGKEYMKMTKFDFVLKPKRGSFQFEHLFNGNKQLGDTMNKFLNENFNDVYHELQHSINKGLSELFGGLGARIFEKASYEEMFPRS